MYLYGLIIFILVLLDQITKILVVKRLEIGKELVIIPKHLRFLSTRNNGAAMGILQGQNALFSIISFVAVMVFVYLLSLVGGFRHDVFEILALILLISGTMGNLICRISRKQVVDFIVITIGKFHSPIFNLADLYLGMGLIGVILSELGSSR